LGGARNGCSGRCENIDLEREKLSNECRYPLGVSVGVSILDYNVTSDKITMIYKALR
jgi:hypothetical protein